MDRVSIPGGVSRTEIAAAIKDASAVLLFCSDNAFSSATCARRSNSAWKHQRPILPLRLDPVLIPQELEYWLEGCQWIDVFDRPEAVWLANLDRALGKDVECGATESVADPASPLFVSDTNLPTPLTELVGRERECAAIVDLIGANRLVTLVGPAGVGKSRLAIEAARTVTESFQGDVHLVDVAPINSPAQVMPAIARALGVRDTGKQARTPGLPGLTASRRILLVLDNVERSLAAAPDIAELLELHPGVTVLATTAPRWHSR